MAFGMPRFQWLNVSADRRRASRARGRPAPARRSVPLGCRPRRRPVSNTAALRTTVDASAQDRSHSARLRHPSTVPPAVTRRPLATKPVAENGRAIASPTGRSPAAFWRQVMIGPVDRHPVRAAAFDDQGPLLGAPFSALNTHPRRQPPRAARRRARRPASPRTARPDAIGEGASRVSRGAPPRTPSQRCAGPGRQPPSAAPLWRCRDTSRCIGQIPLSADSGTPATRRATRRPTAAALPPERPRNRDYCFRLATTGRTSLVATDVDPAHVWCFVAPELLARKGRRVADCRPSPPATVLQIDHRGSRRVLVRLMVWAYWR